MEGQSLGIFPVFLSMFGYQKQLNRARMIDPSAAEMEKPFAMDEYVLELKITRRPRSTTKTNTAETQPKSMKACKINGSDNESDSSSSVDGDHLKDHDSDDDEPFDEGEALLAEEAEGGMGLGASQGSQGSSHSTSALARAEVESALRCDSAMDDSLAEKEVLAGIEGDESTACEMEKQMIHVAVRHGLELDSGVLSTSIDQLVASGLTPEDAAREAALNHVDVLGNLPSDSCTAGFGVCYCFVGLSNTFLSHIIAHC